MSPDKLAKAIIREVPLLEADDGVSKAVAKIGEAGVSALPIVDAKGRLYGVFGEREFMEALFPGYLKQLRRVAFLPRSLDEALEKRDSCRTEPVGRYMNTDHVDVGTDFSDAQVAEIFLHHRVLLVPVVDDGRVTGVITRADFFRRLGERFVERN